MKVQWLLIMSLKNLGKNLGAEFESSEKSSLNFFTCIYNLHRTKDGAICDRDGLVVTVPTVMWIKVRGV